MKLTNQDFWGITLRQYVKLLNLRNEEIKVKMDKKDRWNALICTTIANAPHFTKKDKKPYKLEDFLPTEVKREILDPAAMLERIKILNAQLGGTIVYLEDGC